MHSGILTILFSISSALFAMVGSAETCSHMQTKFFCPLETDWEAISGQKMPTLPLATLTKIRKVQII